jgi:protein-disulfide isomerase
MTTDNTDSHDNTGTPTPPPSPPPAAQVSPQAPAQAGLYPAGAGAYPTAPKTNTLSIVSLVTGFFCGLAAVITGHLALGQIRRTGEAGRGLAIAGLVLGYLGLALTALGIVLAIVFAATIGAFFAAIDSSVDGPRPAPIVATGTVGAAHLDDGYLQVGTGASVVDVYIDPMCPYCAQFDIANGDTLAALVDNDSITLRVHPLTFLDAASQGTAYSSRASAALTCEAALNPESTLSYLAALFVAQPAEGSSGLSDDELLTLSVDPESIRSCVDDGEYLAWAQQNTERAISGPIPGAEIDKIPGTPTVLVDGRQYTGPIDDPQSLTDFILGPVA